MAASCFTVTATNWYSSGADASSLGRCCADNAEVRYIIWHEASFI